MSELIEEMSVFDVFGGCSQTLESAKKKSAEESSGARVSMFKMDKEGTYSVRILPLAPIKGEDGVFTLPRPGYEYPSKELLLKIYSGKDKNGKDKFQYVNVRHLSHIFPQLKEDIVDTFVSLVCEKYASDEALCKAIRSNSFSGGLRYDHKRYMYVLDMDKRSDGLQLLSLSFPQYKDMDDRKLKLWEKEAARNPKAQCPISSPKDAYPVEITRKKDNGKTSYSFDIDRSTAPLTEEELKALLDAQRIPEILYRYSRFHLEATLAFLKQYQAEKKVEVMDDPRFTDLVEKVKLLLPADDQSHFDINGKSEDDAEGSVKFDTFDALCTEYDKLSDAGKTDQSEEGQNLRKAIVEFIDANDLDVAYSRRISNSDLLDRIEAAMGEPAAAGEPDDETPESSPEPDEEDDAPAPTPRRTRNDDTSEPAARTERRAARTTRRSNL